jgi:hypothetical protein
MQYVNVQDKFRYPFPHPQFVWYLRYRIGGKKGTRGKNDRTLVAYRNGDLVDMCNFGYCEVPFCSAVQFRNANTSSGPMVTVRNLVLTCICLTARLFRMTLLTAHTPYRVRDVTQ